MHLAFVKSDLFDVGTRVMFRRWPAGPGFLRLYYDREEEFMTVGHTAVSTVVFLSEWELLQVLLLDGDGKDRVPRSRAVRRVPEPLLE